MSDPQPLKGMAKIIFAKKAEASTPVYAEVHEYFLNLVKALGDAGYQGKKGHDYHTDEDYLYFDREHFNKAHDVLRFDDRSLFLNMLGRTKYYRTESSGAAYDDYSAEYGPYQSIHFIVTPEKTTIAVHQTTGFLAGNAVLIPSRKLHDAPINFDWKDKDKALECITAWVLENSSSEIVDKILPPEERKTAPAIKIVPPATPS